MLFSRLRRRISYLWYRSGDWWIPELISITVSLGLFTVYFLLLWNFHGKNEASWKVWGLFELPFFVTLPSVISFLTTLMRAAIGFPVASAMGQLKWHRFRQRAQSLADFDHFDNATRGMTGSLSFLFSSHFWSPASFGCIIILTGLLFGPFLQNTVKPVVGPRPDYTPEARIPVFWTFNSTHSLADSDTSPEHLVASPQVQAGIARGWFLDHSMELIAEDISGFMHTNCTTTHCKWRYFSTLHLTSECKNSTIDEYDEDARGIPIAISNAAGLNSTRINLSGDREHTDLNMVQSRVIPEASVFADRQDDIALLAHIGILSDYGGQGNATYANGTLIEAYHVSKTTPERRATSITDDFEDVTIRANWSCNSDISSILNSSTSCNYTLKSNAQRGLFNSLSSYIDGWAIPLPHMETDFSSYYDHSAVPIQALHWSWKHNGSIEHVSRQYSENVAFAVSMALRMTSGEYSPKGVTWRDEVVFHVRWEFVALPFYLLLMSMLFFFGVVIGTRKDPLWRNSQLPLFFHGLEDAGPREWEVERLADMWRAADEMNVRMHGEKKSGDMRLRRSDLARASDTELSEYLKVQGHVDVEEARG